MFIMEYLLVIGGDNSPGSLCGVHCGRILIASPCSSLPEAPMLFPGPVLPPNQCCGWWCELFHSSGHHFLQLFVLSHSNLQSSLILSNVYLVAVITGGLVYHLLLLPFRGLPFHSYKQLLQGVLGLENGFHPKGCTGLL